MPSFIHSPQIGIIIFNLYFQSAILGPGECLHSIHKGKWEGYTAWPQYCRFAAHSLHSLITVAATLVAGGLPGDCAAGEYCSHIYYQNYYRIRLKYLQNFLS